MIYRLALCVIILFAAMAGRAQPNVILDADIDSDVDDVAALAMLHHLDAEGKIRLLGVIVTSDDPYAPECADAINRFYTKKRIPIGFDTSQPALKNHSKYTRQLASGFSHQLRSYRDAIDAATLYRRLLAGCRDESVTIVSIGHLSSMAKLLRSGGDKFSTLSGEELVNRKVASWICMGGQFPAGKEANFYRPDPASTVFCLQRWQRPVVFCGWEVGKEIVSGGAALQQLLPPGNPVYQAFALYNNFAGRPSWDQVAVLLLDKKWSASFEAVNDGHCAINADGSNQWVVGPKTNQSYVRIRRGIDPATLVAAIHDMLIPNQPEQ